jgi:hypothetical protein
MSRNSDSVIPVGCAQRLELDKEIFACSITLILKIFVFTAAYLIQFAPTAVLDSSTATKVILSTDLEQMGTIQRREN